MSGSLVGKQGGWWVGNPWMLDQGASPDSLGDGELLKAFEWRVDMERDSSRVMHLALL